MTNIKISAECRSLVENLKAAGKSYTDIFAVTKVLHTKNAKATDAALSQLGVVKGASSKRGLIDEMYDWFEDQPRTQVAFFAWCVKNGSANTLRWFNQHDKVRVHTNKLHRKLGGAEIPVNDVSDLKDKLAAEMKKKAK